MLRPLVACVRTNDQNEKEDDVPEDYKVVKLDNPTPREWSGSGGSEWESYRVTIEPAGGGDQIANVELNEKKGSPAPAPGKELHGDVDTSGQYGPKFKRARKGGFGGGGGGGRAWKPRPDDSPLVYVSRQAGIIRQHSQDVALRILALAAEKHDGDFAGVCADLGLDLGDGDDGPVGLIDAVSRDVSRAAGAAWSREKEKETIKNALADLG
jgi:hypothetical protein